MLLSAVIMLKPRENAIVSRDQGRAIHGWFMDQLGRCDGTLSQAVHDAKASKPFTCSSLMGFRQVEGSSRLQLTPKERGWIRITSLSSDLTVLLEERVLPTLPAHLQVHGATLVVEDVITDASQHPWAGTTSHTALLNKYLKANEPPPPAIRLQFATPTAFRSQGRHVPIPLPDLVVLGWLDRWNAFAAVALPEELRRYVTESLAISSFDLHSEAVDFGQGITIGCVGHCTYRSLNDDPAWLALFHALAEYSFFCGTGHRTTKGLGQTLKVNS